ncbi:hypothetical protein [Cohnella panacarvi]|uniref:hypothetical protein n=1 Tax=Cohnella panacarvi TaxID=400776 RepID=UPI00047A07A9|nr:hypothetical protein [Cohnella panacarvi]
MPLQPIKVLTEAAKSLEELTNELAKMQKILNYLLEGNLDFDNIRARGIKAENIEANSITANEIAANTITADEIAANTITADKMDVNELSAISANLGTINVGTLIGVLIQAATIIGSYIATANGTYPRSEMNVLGNFFGAFKDANNSIKLESDYFGNPIIIQAAGGVEQWLITPNPSGGMIIQSLDDLVLAVSGNIIMNNLGFQVQVQNWDSVYGLGNLQTLQQALDNKANKSAVSKTVYVASTSGGAATTPLTITNGIVTS